MGAGIKHVHERVDVKEKVLKGHYEKYYIRLITGRIDWILPSIQRGIFSSLRLGHGEEGAH